MTFVLTLLLTSRQKIIQAVVTMLWVKKKNPEAFIATKRDYEHTSLYSTVPTFMDVC